MAQPATGTKSVQFDLANVPMEGKLAAVQAETKIKQNALRDTIAANELLQRRIIELQRSEDEARDAVRAAHIDLDEAKKRQTLQRYYRQRAEEEEKDRHHALATLVAQRGHGRQHHVGQQTVQAGRSTGVISDLSDLRVIVADRVNQVAAATTRRDKLSNALKDVVSLRLKLERAMEKQLCHTEVLADDVGKTKKQVSSETVLSAKETLEVRRLERSTVEVARRCRKLENEIRDIERHAARMSQRVCESDAKVGSLQSARSETRVTVLSEAQQSEERDAAIARLRRQNADLLQWLLDDSPNVIPQEEMDFIKERAMALASKEEFALPPHEPRANLRRTSCDPREERLFKQLEDAIRRTTKQFGTTSATAPR